MRSERPLQEGMRPGDLRGLVLPLISVDEYESKVSKQAVVLGFYVKNKAAAEDLNRFVQKSALDILDTEISPAPDQRGFYLCFVELLLDKKLGENTEKLLDEVAPLVGFDNWQLKVRHHRGLLDFKPSDMQIAIAKARGPLQEAAVAAYLAGSELPVATVAGSKLALGQGGIMGEFVIEAFGPSVADNLANRPVETGFGRVAAARRLLAMLGENWNVDPVDGRFVLTNRNDPRSLILRPTA